MDKISKKVYMFLMSQPEHQYNPMYNGTPDFCSEEEFTNAVYYLRDKREYITFKDSTGYIGNITLTHQGVHKRELEIRAFWLSFFTKFLPGFGSGVAVGLVTELLIRLLFRQ